MKLIESEKRIKEYFKIDKMLMLKLNNLIHNFDNYNIEDFRKECELCNNILKHMNEYINN